MMKAHSNIHKKPSNFRLSHQSMLILSLLEEKLHTSKTAVVEKALRYFAEKKLKMNNTLMQFAGMLSDQESDDMLSAIKNDQRNKTLKIKL